MKVVDYPALLLGAAFILGALGVNHFFGNAELALLLEGVGVFLVRPVLKTIGE